MTHRCSPRVSDRGLGKVYRGRRYSGWIASAAAASLVAGLLGLRAGATALAADTDEQEDDNMSLEELRRRARERKAGAGKSEDPVAEGGAPRPKVRAGKRKAAQAAQNDEPEELDVPDVIPVPVHCPNPSEAPPSQPAFLRCVLQPGARADKVVYFYRLPGQEEYVRVEATRTKKGWFTTTVPKEAFTGKWMQFYVEAQAKDGRVVASNGRWDSPNALLIKEGAPILDENTYLLAAEEGRGGADRAEDDDPLRRRTRARNDEYDVLPARRFWGALGLGSGWGGHDKANLEWYEVTNGSRDAVAIPGGTRSVGLLVLFPEIGYRLTSRVSVALAVRAQIVVHTGDESRAPNPMGGSPAPAAFSALAKGIYTLPLGERFTLHVWGGLGGGEGVRYRVDPAPNDPLRARRSSDTVLAGPVLLGAGTALDYVLTEEWSVRLSLPQLLFLMPEVGWAFDFALGGVYAF